MNTKLILIGAIAFWVTTFALSMATGFFIHEGVLDPVYAATQEFWRPELNEDPPNLAALMPHWLLCSFMTSLVVAGIYSCVKSSFKGPGWKKGATWGLCAAIFAAFFLFGFSGVFRLPLALYLWWGIDVVIQYSAGGAVMGWACERKAATGTIEGTFA